MWSLCKHPANEIVLPTGGEIWRQSAFPCFTYYIITGLEGERFMALSPDPRARGNTLRVGKEGRAYTPEELGVWLKDRNFECLGQLHDILENDRESLLNSGNTA